MMRCLEEPKESSARNSKQRISSRDIGDINGFAVDFWTTVMSMVLLLQVTRGCIFFVVTEKY